MKVVKRILGLSIFLFILSGCVTLHLTPQQTLEEYSKVNKKVVYEYYDFNAGFLVALLRGKQYINGLPFVNAYDKAGKKYKVLVDDHTTLRLTKMNGRHVNLYFNTTFLEDSSLYGNRSHFINLPAGPYKITELKRIEIQSASRFVGIVK